MDMIIMRAKARKSPYWTEELDKEPILAGREIVDYLGAMTTNFPSVFVVEENMIKLRDSSRTGVEQAQAHLPYAYFQSSDASPKFASGVRLDGFVLWGQMPKVSLAYCMLRRTPLEGQVLEECIPQVRVSVFEGQFYASEEEGKLKIVFDGVRYHFTEGKGERECDVPDSVERWYKTLPRRYQFTNERSTVSPVVKLSIRYENGQLVVAEGQGEGRKELSYEGVTYQVAEGGGDLLVEIPSPVRSWINQAFREFTWVERDLSRMEAYQDGLYKEVHTQHVASLREMFKELDPETVIVAPADGQGACAEAWPGRGFYGDLVVTAESNPQVVRETAAQTIERALQGVREGDKVLCICSYISVFFPKVPPFPTLWIDHDLILDRGIPGIHRVSEALFTTNCNTTLLAVLDRHGRRKWKPFHVPYTLNLMTQTRLIIPKLSRMAVEAIRTIPGVTVFVPQSLQAYVAFAGVRYVTYGEGGMLTHPPEDVPVLATDFSTMLDFRRAYASFIGRVVSQEDAQPFVLIQGKIRSRTIYRVRSVDSHKIPVGAYREEIFGDYYFALPEHMPIARATHRRGEDFFFSQYNVREYDQGDWTVDQMILSRLNEGSSREEVREAVVDVLGYSSSEMEKKYHYALEGKQVA